MIDWLWSPKSVHMDKGGGGQPKVDTCGQRGGRGQNVQKMYGYPLTMPMMIYFF